MANNNEVEVKYLMLNFLCSHRLRNTLYLSRLFTVRRLMKVVGDKATSKTVRNYLEEWHDMGVITLDKHKRPMQIKPGDYMEDTYEMYKELLRMEIKNAKQKYTNLNEVLE